MNRHRREQHGDGGVLQRRRYQQRRRNNAERAIAPAEAPADLEDALYYVTAPAHRESMWEQARDRLLAVGVPLGRIRRRHGIHWSEYEQLESDAAHWSDLRHDLPRGLQRNTFLMYDFHRRFLPACQEAFRASGGLSLVYWIEDDINFARLSRMSDINSIAASQNTCLSWLGYKRVKGKPKWGTHIMAVHRAGVDELLAVLNGKAQVARDGGRPMSYLMGLDTWVSQMCEAKTPTGRSVAMASAKSLAQQSYTHAFVGRR